MSFPAITPLTTPEVKSIGKMLLCAWSAEYALRVTPLVQDAEYARTSLAWTFPQAYYAAFFSARAVLASDGIHLANLNGVNTLMNQRAGAGFYGPSLTTETNPFATLMGYQLGSRIEARQVSSLEAVSLNRSLIESVWAIALIHEGYILQRIGEEAYVELIAGVPSYLAKGFVQERVRVVITRESGNVMERSS